MTLTFQDRIGSMTQYVMNRETGSAGVRNHPLLKRKNHLDPALVCATKSTGNPSKQGVVTWAAPKVTNLNESPGVGQGPSTKVLQFHFI